MTSLYSLIAEVLTTRLLSNNGVRTDTKDLQQKKETSNMVP